MFAPDEGFEFSCGAFGDDAAAVDDSYLVCKSVGFLQILGGQK